MKSPLVLIAALIVLTTTASAANVRFVVVGDSRGDDNGINAPILGEIAQAIVDENATFVLFPGDLVNGSSDPAILESQLLNWRTTLQPVYNAGIGVYPVRGNHDTGSMTAWDNVFIGPYALPPNGPPGEVNITYSFTHATVFVAGLDQYISSHRVNQSWLDDQFAANDQPHVFLLAHEPAFKADHSSCMDDEPVARNILWNSIADEGGRTYFAGHDHFYDHMRLDDGDGNTDDDLHQFIVGTGGAPLRDDDVYNGDNDPWVPVRVFHEKEYGYLRVEIDGLQVTLTWMKRIGPDDYQPGGDVMTYTVPAPPCTADFNGDTVVDTDDFLEVLGNWGACPTPCPPTCPGDTTDDCNVNVDDFLAVLGAWGSCIGP